MQGNHKTQTFTSTQRGGEEGRRRIIQKLIIRHVVASQCLTIQTPEPGFMFLWLIMEIFNWTPLTDMQLSKALNRQEGELFSLSYWLNVTLKTKAFKGKKSSIFHT